MDLETAFEILELDMSAEINEVRTAYRDLAEIWHPDKYTHKPRLAEKAAAKMKEINCAYDVIKEHFRNNESSFKANSGNESEEEGAYDFIDCINCGTTNRVSKDTSPQNLKCGKCGLNLNGESEKTNAFCGLSTCEGRILSNGRCSVCGRTLSEGVQAEEAYASNRNTVNAPSGNHFFGGIHHPWRRFFARAIDTCVGASLFLIIIYVFSNLYPREAFVFLKYFENPIIAGIIVSFLWFPLEAAFLSTVGTTPARLLFGISVRTTSGRKLSFDQALTRSFQVLLQGDGLGIPFVAFFTQFFAYRRLVQTGTTLWDTATGSVVSHKEWRVIRAILCTFAVFSISILVWISKDYQQHTTKTPGVESVIRNRPDELNLLLQARALNDQGDTYYDTKQYAKAIEAYQQAIQIDSDYVLSWKNIGIVFNHIGQTDKAIAACQQAIRIKPDYDEAWYILGVAYAHSDQTAKAIEAYQQAVNINQNYAVAWNSLGVVYSDTGQTDKAIEAYQQAIKISQNYAIAWYNLGIAYKNLGQNTEVINVYNRLKLIDLNEANDFYIKVINPQGQP